MVFPVIQFFQSDFSTNQNIIHKNSFCDQNNFPFSSILLFTFDLNDISDLHWWSFTIDAIVSFAKCK